MSSQQHIDSLVGKRCIGAIAQKETGGDLLLHFGREVPYSGSGGPKLKATHRGEWSLMIECPWRLENSDYTVADWTTVTSDSPERRDQHLVLNERTVASVQLADVGPDLTIRFDGGFTLTVFCGLEPSFPECWFLLLPDGRSVVAGPGGRVSIEEPEQSPSTA
jgi:hypothetical protein